VDGSLTIIPSSKLRKRKQWGHTLGTYPQSKPRKRHKAYIPSRDFDDSNKTRRKTGQHSHISRILNCFGYSMVDALLKGLVLKFIGKLKEFRASEEVQGRM